MKAFFAYLITLLLIMAVACGGQANDDALLQASAECLHEKRLAQLAGETSVAETVATLRAGVESGDKTIAEIQQAYDLICKE